MTRTPSRVLFSLAAVLWAAAAFAQDAVEGPRQTFRSSVDVVTIQTSVRTPKGRPVRGLTQADFEVRDNGELRPILSVRSDDASPVSVVVLMDMSGSMSVGPKMEMARLAFESILASLRPGQDEAALYTFDSSLEERVPFTTDPSLLAAKFDTVQPFGTTSLWDATAAVARHLANRSAAHKAIVVLTDGTDTSSRLTAPEVSGLASSIAVPVYVVATVPSIDQRAMLEAASRNPQSDAADLTQLAEWTGGRLVFASTATETTVVAAGLVSELRQQYVIAIEATGVREWRRLDVRVKRPSAVVKARSGYFGG